MAVIGNAPFQGLVSGGNIIDASIEGVDLSTSAIAARLGYTPVDPGAAVFTANPTISSGTANSVSFLNGSKVVSGSSNLTFDGTTLTAAGFSGPLNGTVGATTAASGAFTTVSASGAVTLSGGTTSGVAYLSGSKVVTSNTTFTFNGTNVGIGLGGVATNAKLEVAATTGEIFRADGTGGGFRIVANQTDILLQGVTSIQNWINGTIGMRLTSTGLGIGLGATDPYAKLTVKPNSGWLNVTSGRVDATNNVRLEAAGTVSTYLEYRGYLGHIWDVDVTEQMRLTSGYLSVSPPSGAAGLGIGSAAGRAQYQYINFGGGVGGTDYAWQIGRNSSTAGVGPADGFYIYDIKATATRLAIDNAGRVLVGTTSPGMGSAKFTVTGNAVVFSPNTDGANTHIFTTGAVDDGTYAISNASSVTRVYLRANGSSYFNGGNLGIGTNDPAVKLHIIGNQIRHSNSTNAAYYGTFEHDAFVTGANIYNSQDGGGHLFKNSGVTTFSIVNAGDAVIYNGRSLFFNNGVNTANASIACTGGGTLSLRSYGQEMISLYEDNTILFKIGSGSEKMRIASTGNVTIGSAIAATNVVLNFNGVANKAKRLVFQDSGVDQWIVGSGAASENDAFEIYNANGQMALSFAKATSNAAFVGNVKVGSNTSSGQTLTINGNGNSGDGASLAIQVVGTTKYQIGRAAAIVSGVSPAFGYWAASSLGHEWYVNGGTTPNMALAASGNLMIGTTNPDVGGSVDGIILKPDGRLHIANSGTGFYDYTFYADRRGTNNAGKILVMGLGGYLKASIGVVGSNGVANDGGITFNTIYNNDTQVQQMRIDANGVSISNSNNVPEVKLEVNGGADGSVVFGGRSDGGNGNNRRFNLVAFADGGGAGYGGGLKIQTRDSVNVFADRITVKSDGNVGIGTTTPYKPLQIRTTAQAAGTYYLATIGGSNYVSGYAVGLGFDPEGYGYRNKIAIIAEGNNQGYSRGKLHIAFNTLNNATEASIADSKVTFLESGFVGIGTNDPGERLTVNGSIRSTTNAINFSGQTGAQFDYYNGEMRFAVHNGSNTSIMYFNAGTGKLNVPGTVINNQGGGIGSTSNFYAAASISPTSTSGGVAIYDLYLPDYITVTDAMDLELYVHTNPNGGGSGSYRQTRHITVHCMTTWYGSGYSPQLEWDSVNDFWGMGFDVVIYHVATATEFATQLNSTVGAGQSYFWNTPGIKLRVKVSGFNSTYPGSQSLGLIVGYKS